MLYPAQHLPLSTLTLDDWQLVKVSGADNSKFLQGQLTADINQLNESHWLLSVHCDPKGKTLSNLLLFKRADDIYYIVRKSVLDRQIDALKKFAIFSKVTIAADFSLTMMGLVGRNITSVQIEELTKLTKTNNCATIKNLTYIKIDYPEPRYIVIGPSQDMASLSVLTHLPRSSSQQWTLLDMQANYPIIDLKASEQFLPQAFNLQLFDAISFTKGCYCGQEMVARAQYRGINKRALYLLTGKEGILPAVGETLEQKIGDNWRETGFILTSLKLQDNTIWVQAILNNDLSQDEMIFRLKNSQQSLTIYKK